MNVAKILRPAFFYRTPPVAVFKSTRRRRIKRKRGTKEQGRTFQMKEENENI